MVRENINVKKADKLDFDSNKISGNAPRVVRRALQYFENAAVTAKFYSYCIERTVMLKNMASPSLTNFINLTMLLKPYIYVKELYCEFK